MKRYLPVLLILILAAVTSSAACDSGESIDDVCPSGAGCPAPSAPPDKITFMAGFKAQANLPFVGVYVAKEKGFFEAQNLDVDVQHVTTPGDNYPLLASGRVQFSTSDAAELLNHRAGDPSLPLVSIALIGQTGQQGFAVLANSGINTPEDWTGKTAGYKGSTVPPDYLAILEATGVDRSSITEVRTGFDPAVLTEHQVDIWPVFLSNEPDTLQRAGYETKLFTAADYGAPTLGLTYVTTEDYAAQNSDIARRFVAAALEGISYARDHRDEAIDIVLQYGPGADRDHQRFMLDTELEMAEKGVAPTGGIGYQVLGQWQALRDYLVQYNAIPSALPDIAKAFTVDFLPHADGGSVTPTP